MFFLSINTYCATLSYGKNPSASTSMSGSTSSLASTSAAIFGALELQYLSNLFDLGIDQDWNQKAKVHAEEYKEEYEKIMQLLPSEAAVKLQEWDPTGHKRLPVPNIEDIWSLDG